MSRLAQPKKKEYQLARLAILTLVKNQQELNSGLFSLLLLVDYSEYFWDKRLNI